MTGVLLLNPVFKNSFPVASMHNNSTELFITADSLKELFRLYGEKVYTICYHHSGHAEDAQDMVQDIFKSLWERKDVLQINTSIEHYLLKAARLRVLEYVRNQTSRKAKLAEVQRQAIVFNNLTQDQIDLQDRYRELTHIIGTQSAHTREVFTLSRLRGWSNPEIARFLSLSEKAVEYHLTKSLKAVRSSLDTCIDK